MHASTQQRADRVAVTAVIHSFIHSTIKANRLAATDLSRYSILSMCNEILPNKLSTFIKETCFHKPIRQEILSNPINMQYTEPIRFYRIISMPKYILSGRESCSWGVISRCLINTPE